MTTSKTKNCKKKEKKRQNSEEQSQMSWAITGITLCLRLGRCSQGAEVLPGEPGLWTTESKTTGDWPRAHLCWVFTAVAIWYLHGTLDSNKTNICYLNKRKNTREDKNTKYVNTFHGIICLKMAYRTQRTSY